MADVVPYTLNIGNWSDYPVQDALPREKSGEVPFVFKDWENYPVRDALPRPKSGPTDYDLNFMNLPVMYTPPKVDENGIEYKERPKEEAPKKDAPKGGTKPPKTQAQTTSYAEK